MTPVVGVDGGATRSRGILLDHGEEVAAAEGPAAALEAGGIGEAVDALEGLVRDLAEAGGTSLPLEVLSCGLAGAGRTDLREATVRALEERGIARRVAVGTDVEAAFRDAFERGEPGLLLVAGTGSVARARGPEGRTARVGGWGALLGDEGSGYRIGLEGLRVVLRAHDGRIGPTSLRPAILAAMDVEHPPALVERTAAAPKAAVAALAPAVIRAAEEGDAAAARIVDEAVGALLELARTAASEAGAAPDAAPVALAGGLLDAGRPLRRRVARALRDDGFRVLEGPVRAERGAAALVRDPPDG